MVVPTMYLEEKSALLHRAVERLAEPNDSPKHAEALTGDRLDKWQYDLLLEIRSLASVLHTEADEWIGALDRRAIDPTSTVKVVPNGG